MYADAYPSAISTDRLERLARAAVPCWTGAHGHRAWSCALRAAGDSFCPCLALAAGGVDGEREQAILDAIADEMKRCAECEIEAGGTEPLADQPPPLAAGTGWLPGLHQNLSASLAILAPPA